MATPKLLKQAVSSSAVQSVVAALASAYYLFVRWTSHVERPPIPAGGPFIIAMWHGQLAMLSELRTGERAMVALISGHRDGQTITRCAHHYGIATVTGSSTRGGLAAVRQLLRLAGAGHSIFITPDGPRGPRRQVNAGIIEIARLSGLPILPAAIGNSRGWELNSWDRFRIPAPFGRIAVRWGRPVRISATDGFTAANLARVLTELQDAADAEVRR
jgi:lysophospholipid acyltransferase (LPLAT)-like uncharacterized protein